MSSGDYISKSTLIMSLRDYQFGNFSTVEFAKEYNLINEIIEGVEIQPTLNEKEIIRKTVERVIKQLNEQMPIQFNGFGKTLITVEDVVKILKEECGISE